MVFLSFFEVIVFKCEKNVDEELISVVKKLVEDKVINVKIRVLITAEKLAKANMQQELVKFIVESLEIEVDSDVVHYIDKIKDIIEEDSHIKEESESEDEDLTKKSSEVKKNEE